MERIAPAIQYLEPYVRLYARVARSDAEPRRHRLQRLRIRGASRDGEAAVAVWRAHGRTREKRSSPARARAFVTARLTARDSSPAHGPLRLSATGCALAIVDSVDWRNSAAKARRSTRGHANTCSTLSCLQMLPADRRVASTGPTRRRMQAIRIHTSAVSEKPEPRQSRAGDHMNTGDVSMRPLSAAQVKRFLATCGQPHTSLPAEPASSGTYANLACCAFGPQGISGICAG